jgi:hypothetical protein
MMVRTQISLPPELHRKAKRRAAAEGVSLSELARRGLEREVTDSEPSPKRDISAIFGIAGPGSPSDIARHKELYLAEASQREYERKLGLRSKDEGNRRSQG